MRVVPQGRSFAVHFRHAHALRHIAAALHSSVRSGLQGRHGLYVHSLCLSQCFTVHAKDRACHSGCTQVNNGKHAMGSLPHCQDGTHHAVGQGCSGILSLCKAPERARHEAVARSAGVDHTDWQR